jgi:Putative zinc-finger
MMKGDQMPDERIIVEISCIEVWRQISDYVDDDVNPEMKARLEHHFENCKHCKAILDGAQNIVALIGDEQTFAFDDAISDRITSGLAQKIASLPSKDE